MVRVDGKHPNLALMKLSAYHKAQGDSVSLFTPILEQPDLVYGSKVFTSTPDYGYYPSGIPVLKGGTGYNLTVTLPEEVESCYPDYDLFGCDYAMGFTTRGCIRRCSFCVVPEKEGRIRAVGDLYSFWRDQEQVMLLDNNLTALPEHFERVCLQLIEEGVMVDFSQGLDIRLITAEMARLLSRVRLWKQIHFAFDHVAHEDAVRRGIDILAANGVAKHKLMLYVLIGYDSTHEQDLYRVEMLRGLGVDPFVMPYNRNDPYQRAFARWVNHKAIWRTVAWDDYHYATQQERRG